MNADKKGVCHNCDKRYVGCHSECEEYIDWKAQHKAEQRYIEEKKKAYREQISYSRASYEREARRRGKW